MRPSTSYLGSGIILVGAGLILPGCPGGADLDNPDTQIDMHSQLNLGAGEYCADVPAVFERGCGFGSTCHKLGEGTFVSGGIDLISPGVEARLLDVVPSYPGLPECESTPRLLINSAAPEESYLWKKVNNTQDCGDAMPYPYTPASALTEEELDCVRSWIDGVIASAAQAGSE